jgi:hypothetical protein
VRPFAACKVIVLSWWNQHAVTLLTASSRFLRVRNCKSGGPMLKTTLAAAFIAASFAVPAHAIPASSPTPSISDALIEPIQVRDDRHRHARHGHHRHARHGHHRAHRHHGHRHRHSHAHRHWHGHHRYRGWHRYQARPWNWRARGCVVVGPVWFCP